MIHNLTGERGAGFWRATTSQTVVRARSITLQGREPVRRMKKQLRTDLAAKKGPRETAETVGNWILKLLYPPRCPVCDKIWADPEKLCCPSCAPNLPWVRGAVCLKCGKPVEKDAEYCRDCRVQKHQYTQGTAAFTYAGGLPDAVYRMKYQNRRDYLEFFTDSIIAACGQKIRRWNPQMILYVPMHWRRQGMRGFNQSELLAEHLGRKTGIPVEKGVLKCVRKTKAQKTLGRAERQKNLKGSFQVAAQLKNVRSVLVVDDIYTTGSTMDEIAGTLRQAGVVEVYFAVICVVD